MAEASPAPAPERELPEHVTLPLLTLITQQSLDEDYRHVAEQRARAGDDRPGRPSRTTAAVFVLIGLLLVVAGLQTSRNSSAEESGRASLIAQVNDRRAGLGELQAAQADHRDRIAELEARLVAVSDEERAERTRLRRLQTRTGYVEVSGPGVRIAVDDAPDADPTQVVRDEDLAILLNGLWQAGAEAIAVNGQRLTVLSSIHNVGPAIHVNSRPVNPPYEILAIADPARLQADFVQTSSGLTWLNLRSTLGFEFSMTNEERLTLPAARQQQLRSAVEGTSSDRRPTDEEIAS